MTKEIVQASEHSVAVGEGNNAPIVNVHSAPFSRVSVSLEQKINKELPSFLAKIITSFSEQNLTGYGDTQNRDLPPEVEEKIRFNNISRDDYLIADWTRYSHILERVYKGVEQQNADARFLVRRKAKTTYQSELSTACNKKSVPFSQKTSYATQNASALVESTIQQMMQHYASTSGGISVEEEIAHLAVSLVVADAVVECDVLERPTNAVTA
ncbi:MAG: hypothetical protein PHD48_12125 [Alphaproteobacteria bacterium]|nr:hypothetical protein [Alphaproteobacteria bacterium]